MCFMDYGCSVPLPIRSPLFSATRLIRLSREATHLIIRPSLLSGCQEKPPTLLSGHPSYQVVKRSHPHYYQAIPSLIRLSREATHLIIRPSLLSGCQEKPPALLSGHFFIAKDHFQQ